MADWKDDYRQGSFRGIEFKTLSHTFKSGRRNVDHEFPSKEEGNSEDIGKKLPRFTLNLYVLGDDYFAQRDELIEALDTEGPGELLHPYLGAKRVQVGSYSLTETVAEGRIARFSVDFTTAGEAKFPAEDTDAFQAVIDSVFGALEAANSALEAGFTIINTPARVATAAADTIGEAADLIDNMAKTVGTGAQGIADVAFAIRNIKADVNSLMRIPGDLASRFQDAFALLFDAIDDKKQMSRVMSNVSSNFSPDPVIGGDTPTVNRIKGNQVAFENFFVQSSVATASQAAVLGNFVSVDESVDIKDLLNRDIAELLPKLQTDDSYQAMRDLEVAVNKALPPQDVGELVNFTPPKTLPALVIVHKIFGNIDQEEELINQNNIRHPGFVPAGIELEVASV